MCLGQFTLDGIVRDIIPGTRAGTAYISGDFTRVTGANGVAAERSKIALVDLDDCSVDPTFTPSGADGMVTDLVLSGSRLFVGGDFTAIDRQQIRHLAELDPVTGRVRQAFKFTFGTTSLPAKIRGLGVTPDGRRLIFGGRFGTGRARSATASRRSRCHRRHEPQDVHGLVLAGVRFLVRAVAGV